MSISTARKLKVLEVENRKLKCHVADFNLSNQVFRNLLKKFPTTKTKKSVVIYMILRFGLSELKVCKKG